jgi:predicted DNA-binding protein with PD1-like motif
MTVALPDVPISRGETLRHPGPVAQERVVCVPTRLTAYDIELPAGTPLLQALADLLATTGCASATGQLVGGEMAEFNYYIPALGPQGGPVATFSAPRVGASPGQMVRGGITIGHRDGAVFCHSHSLFVDADGVERAGHLIPDQVVLGAGVHAQVWGSTDVALESVPDPETMMTLFSPRRVAHPGRGDVAAVVCRVRPNVDLVGVVEALADHQGWDTAAVRGQVGSLVGGRLEQPDGSVTAAAGPATEVMFLDGVVRRVDGRMTADLSAHLVDRHARVHRGRVLPGQNAVALTYELVLSEVT